MTTKSPDTSPVSDELNTELETPAPNMAGSDANAAASSDAEDTDATELTPSLLDIVKSVVKKEPDELEGSSPSTEKSEEKAEATDGEPAEEKVDDADLPFHNHPRWKEVLEERNTAREEAQTFRHDADQYRQITDYMDATGLKAEEVSEGFAIMGMLKSSTPENLIKARDWFAERLNWLNENTGHTLPADLQEKVDQGLIDEDSARELSLARVNRASITVNAEAESKRNEEAKAAEDRTRIYGEMKTAVQAWEDGAKKSDAEYSKKAKLVETQSRAIIQRDGKIPQTADEAVALAKRAYAEVNEMFKDFVPKPRPVTPRPAGSSARASTAVPGSLRDAVKAGLNRS